MAMPIHFGVIGLWGAQLTAFEVVTAKFSLEKNHNLIRILCLGLPRDVRSPIPASKGQSTSISIENDSRGYRNTLKVQNSRAPPLSPRSHVLLRRPPTHQPPPSQ